MFASKTKILCLSTWYKRWIDLDKLNKCFKALEHHGVPSFDEFSMIVMPFYTGTNDCHILVQAIDLRSH